MKVSDWKRAKLISLHRTLKAKSMGSNIVRLRGTRVIITDMKDSIKVTTHLMGVNLMVLNGECLFKV